MEFFTALAIGASFGIGIFQLLRRNLIRSAIGIIIISNAINLFLLSAGAYQGKWLHIPPRSDSARMRCLKHWS
jgi:multicomponent Na+:H+ antiporter subunit C